MIMNRFFAVAIMGGLLALGACGGGGGSGELRIEGAQPKDISPTSILFSDMLISPLIGRKGIDERASDITCQPDLSICQVIVQKQTFTFETSYPGPAATGTIYTALEEWNHMNVGVVYAHFQGFQARYSLASGVVHSNSILRGSATWSGEMVGLDANNRVVRGEAAISLTDFRDPRVDVRLEPRSYPVMVWYALPVQSGRFSNERTTSDYIGGEFYGPNAEEVGGVFERNRIVGAFGARR